MQVPKRITHRVYHEEMQKRSLEEAKRNALLSNIKGTSDLKAQADGENRANNLKRRNMSAALAAEMVFQNEYESRVECDRRKQRDQLQQSILAKVIGDKKREQLTWKNKVAQLCESDPELRQLQDQLKAAYINQERAAQQEEKRLIQNELGRREAALDAAMEQDRQFALLELHNKDLARKNIAQESRSTLLDQMDFRRQQAEKEGYAEFVKDKAQIDEIMRKVAAEDEQEQVERRERAALSRKFARDAMVERQKFLEAETRRQEQESRKNREYAERMANRGQAEAAKKQAAADEAERKYKIIEAEARRKRLAEEEMNNLRDMLWEEEKALADDRKARERVLRSKRLTAEMISANEYQKKIKAEVRAKDMEEEMALRTKMLAKFEADEARERKNVLLRLEAKRNYVRDIEEQRLTKKNMYYEEIAREKEDLRQQEENEDFRRQVVAEARRRLLEEHASKLHGFLPKGVIKNREEFEILQRAAASKNQ
mgnify:CR=1 FL=1|jgi:hypothetical protein